MAQSLVNKATARGKAKKPKPNAAENSKKEVVVILVFLVLRRYSVVARWREKVQSAFFTAKCGIKGCVGAARGTKVSSFVFGEEKNACRICRTCCACYIFIPIVLRLPLSTPRAEVIIAVFKSFAAVATSFISVHRFLLHCRADSSIWYILLRRIRYYIILCIFIDVARASYHATLARSVYYAGTVDFHMISISENWRCCFNMTSVDVKCFAYFSHTSVPLSSPAARSRLSRWVSAYLSSLS